jgi:WD40 repeat protein
MRLFLLFNVLLLIVSCGGVKELKDLSEPFQLTDAPLIASQLYAQGDLALTMSTQDVTLWNTKNEQAVFRHLFEPSKEGQLLADLSTDQQFLVTAGKQTVSLHEIKGNNKALIWKVYGTVEEAKISALAISTYGDKVIVGLTDGSVSVTDIRSKTRLLYQPHLSEILFLRLNKMNNKLITAGVDGRLVVLSLDSGIIEQEYQFPSRVAALNIDLHSNRLFAADTLSNEIVSHLDNINDTRSLTYVERYRHFRHSIFVNDTKLVSSNSKYHLSIWDLQTGDELAKGVIEGNSASASITSLAIKDNTIISLTNEGILQYWPVPTD